MASEAETGTGVETRERTQDENGDGSEGSREDGNENGRGRRKGGEFWYPPYQERSRVQGQALPFHTRYLPCIQGVAPAGSQQFWARGPGPARQCGTEGITGFQGRERGIGDGNEDEDGGSGHEDRDGCENKSKDEDENREEGGGDRESGNPRRGNRGESEDVSEGATPTSNQEPQRQDPTP